MVWRKVNMYRSEHHWDDNSSSFQWWPDSKAGVWITMLQHLRVFWFHDFQDVVSQLPPLPRQLPLHPLRHQSHPPPPFLQRLMCAIPTLVPMEPPVWKMQTLTNAYACPATEGTSARLVRGRLQLMFTNKQQPLRNNRMQRKLLPLAAFIIAGQRSGGQMAENVFKWKTPIRFIIGQVWVYFLYFKNVFSCFVHAERDPGVAVNSSVCPRISWL